VRTTYIVQGSSVQYGEFFTWLVRAFLSEALAETFAAACFAEAIRVRKAQTNLVKDGDINDYWAAWRAIPPNCHDPDHRNGDERYAVLSLPLYDCWPTEGPTTNSTEP